MKYYPHRMDLVDAVQRAKGPMDAAVIGRTTSNPLCPQWNEPFTPPISILRSVVDDSRGPAKVIELYKDWVMYLVVHCKFQQNKDLNRILLGTLDSPIIEDTSYSGDPYWGWGPSRIGINKLGKILMAVRDDLACNPTLDLGQDIDKLLGL
jgi:predicted NAD-dependent protein-ADP-ribosyltransferase YbiA (DUF1768 family)